MHKHITYILHTINRLPAREFYERISSNKFLISSSPWEYARFDKGGAIFGGWTIELHAAKLLATRGVPRRLRGGFGGMLPWGNFLHGAIWCILEHIFINFLFEKILKIFSFSTKIMINCSHYVLARDRYRSMIH